MSTTALQIATHEQHHRERERHRGAVGWPRGGTNIISSRFA